MKNFNAESDIIRFRETTEDDLDFVLKAENDPANRDFITQWTKDKHREIIASDISFHVICETITDNQKIGYMIIYDETKPPHCSIKLQRIVITEKGEGFGRKVLQLLKKQVFEVWKAHRLWFDVMQKNVRAQNLYLSEGFIVEGRWRECMITEDGFETLLLMSILDREYLNLQK